MFADLFLGVARERIKEFKDLEIGATMGELKNVLAESMDRWPDKWVQKGHAEGLEKGLKKGHMEGREEGVRIMLHRQLEQKFGPIPESALEKIDSAAYEQLERWTGRVIYSKSLQQILSD